MNGGGLQLDTATGNSDLAWLLVLLFFITTVIALRPAALVGEVAADEGPQGQPVVVSFEVPEGSFGVPDEPAELLLVSPGESAPPGEGRGVLDWLSTTCEGVPVTVQVRCPEEATHLWCRQRMGELMKGAPECLYQY